MVMLITYVSLPQADKLTTDHISDLIFLLDKLMEIKEPFSFFIHLVGTS